MEKEDTRVQDIPQVALSREELERHLRARAWKDGVFRQEFLTHPKAVLQRDFAAWFPEGKIPSELSIKVVEEDEQSICFVLPPKTTDALPDPKVLEEDELSAISGGGTDKLHCWTWVTCKITGCRIMNGIRL